MNFNSMKELMSHLMNGGAITNMDDSCKDCWVSFYQGNLYYPDGTGPVTNLGDHSHWKPVPQEWILNTIHRMTPKVKKDEN
jgi:hypothetical protein